MRSQISRAKRQPQYERQIAPRSTRKVTKTNLNYKNVHIANRRNIANSELKFHWIPVQVLEAEALCHAQSDMYTVMATSS
jgi:hypothetical protein